MRWWTLAGLAVVLAYGTTCRAQDSPVYEGKPLAHWIKVLRDPNSKGWGHARQVLEGLGPRDRAAAPLLLRALGEEDPPKPVRDGLLGIGSAAVPALVEALKDRDAAVRAAAADVLLRLGEEARKAVPALRQALKDAEAGVRVAAARALWLLEGDDREVLPVLAGGLAAAKPAVRLQAAHGLGLLGPKARAAAPALVEQLKKDEALVALAAAMALASIDPTIKGAGPHLLAAFRSRDPYAFVLVVDAYEGWPGMVAVGDALRRYGPVVVPHLVKALKEQAQEPLLPQERRLPSARARTAELLGTIGPAARDAVPALVAALKEDDPLLRAAAGRALRRIGPSAVPELIRGLQDSDSHDALIPVLQAHGRAALPALLRALDDKDPHVRAGVLAALGNVRFLGEDLCAARGRH